MVKKQSIPFGSDYFLITKVFPYSTSISIYQKLSDI